MVLTPLRKRILITGKNSRFCKFLKNDLKRFNGLIYMHAQSDVLVFYEKMGFKKEGTEFEEAGIMHFKMILKN